MYSQKKQFIREYYCQVLFYTIFNENFVFDISYFSKYFPLVYSWRYLIYYIHMLLFLSNDTCFCFVALKQIVTILLSGLPESLSKSEPYRLSYHQFTWLNSGSKLRSTSCKNVVTNYRLCI